MTTNLFLQFSLVMGMLIFGFYLSLTFLISTDANDSRLLFTLGYFLYSFVPSLR